MKNNEDMDEYLDWTEELAYYAAINKCRIYKRKMDSGYYEYVVADKYGEIYLTVESRHNLMFAPRKRRRKKKKRT